MVAACHTAELMGARDPVTSQTGAASLQARFGGLGSGAIALPLAVVAIMLGVAWTLATLPGTDSVRLTASLPFLATLLVLAIGLWQSHAAHRVPLLSPLVFAALAYSVIFCFVPLADVWQGNPAVSSSGWSKAGWLACAASPFIFVGFALGTRFTVRATIQHAPVWATGWATLVALAGLGVGLLAVFIYVGGPQGLLVLVSQFSDRSKFLEGPALAAVGGTAIAAAAILVHATTAVAKPNALRTVALLAVWIPLSLLVSGFSAQRFHLFAIIVALIAIYHFGRRRLPTMVTILAFAALIVTFVYIGQQRNVVGTNQAAPSIAGESFYTNYVSSHELGQFRDFATTYERIPDALPYQYGRTFASVLPGTPFPTSGALFTSTFFPQLWYANVSIPTPLVGELYMNFAIPGVLLGMLIFGCWLGYLNRYLRDNPHRLGAILLYSYSIPFPALVLRGEFTTMFGSYLIGLVFLLVAVRLIEPRGFRATVNARAEGDQAAAV